MSQPVRILDDDFDGIAVSPAERARDLAGALVDGFRAAIALLTRVPIGGRPIAGTGVRAFALVGALLGLTMFLPLATLGPAMPTVSAIIALALVALLSGGLHLDGLADTFDALVAAGLDAADRARRDPAVGAAGATSLILVLGLDVAALSDLVANRGVVVAGAACVVAGTVSRLIPAVLAGLSRSAVAPDGLGAWFAHRTGARDVAIVTLTGLVVVLASALVLGRWELAAAGIVGGAVSLGAGLGLVRLRRSVDGDLLGASVEIAFAITLVIAAGLAGWPGA